jgi:hypothetical protein
MPRSRKCGSIHPLRHTFSWCSAQLVKHRDNFTFSQWNETYTVTRLDHVSWQCLELHMYSLSVNPNLEISNVPRIKENWFKNVSGKDKWRVAAFKNTVRYFTAASFVSATRKADFRTIPCNVMKCMIIMPNHTYSCIPQMRLSFSCMEYHDLNRNN